MVGGCGSVNSHSSFSQFLLMLMDLLKHELLIRILIPRFKSIN